MSLARRTASSVSRTFITPTTGPKLSSTITFIEWSTSVITVGGYQSPSRSRASPPVRIVAPLWRASATWSLTTSVCGGKVIAPTSWPYSRPSMPCFRVFTSSVKRCTNSS